MNRKYFRHRQFIGFIFVCCLLLASTTSDPLEKIVSGFSRYLEQLPQEKVYLHFDRPYYAAGDSVWFRAYLVAGPYHEPSTISNIIYVDLLDPENKVIRRTNLLSLNGMASSSMAVPDSVTSGRYTVRAYTNWMRNMGDNYLFQRTFKVWGHGSEVAKESQDNLDLQFFPEGGELVAGLPSKVAFKAIGGDGLGRTVTGKIYDGTTVVAEIKSNGMGMGIFYLTPLSGKTYVARIDNSDLTFALPAIKEKGLTMAVTHSAKSKDITVAVRSKDAEIKSLYLLAHVRGYVCFSASISMSTNVAIVKMPKSNFPTGIAQIVVLSAEGIPLAERLIFVDQQDDISVKVTSDKPVYEPREAVTIDIQTTNSAGAPVAATLSLSAVDSKQITNSANRESIKTYLLISSELKGHIESPGYYFNINNADREQALDFLMLSQGWRKLSARQAIAETKAEPTFAAEKGLTIKGILVDAYSDKPIVDGKVTFLGFDPLPQTKTVTTDNNGRFEIQSILYFNTSNAILRGETKKGSKAVKIILSDPIPDILSSSMASVSDKGEQSSEKLFLEQSKERHQIDALYNVNGHTITLKEIEVEGKKEDPESSVRRPYGKGTKSIKVADNLALENQLHPLQLVQGRFPGVQVVGIGDAWKVQMQGAGSILSGTTPLIMIDDIPVSIETLNTLPTNQVESVTVWRGPDAAIFGSRGANGAIGFYTKKSFVQRQQPSGESGVMYLRNGLEIERLFYTPRYDIASSVHSKPDRRVTIFWAPYVQTDSMGRARVTFFNHDVETKITGTIEGISAAGEPAQGSFSYEIKKNK